MAQQLVVAFLDINQVCKRLNFFCYYSLGANNKAKTKALLDGLLQCQMLSQDTITIQTYSKLVVGWVSCLFRIPYHLKHWWRKIISLPGYMDWSIQHTYREGNDIAYYLSKKGFAIKANRSLNTPVGILREFNAKINMVCLLLGIHGVQFLDYCQQDIIYTYMKGYLSKRLWICLLQKHRSQLCGTYIYVYSLEKVFGGYGKIKNQKHLRV